MADKPPMTGENDEPMADETGLLLPHYRTFSAVANYFNRTYRPTWDEAVRNNAENAIAMRRDTFIMGLLEERYMQVAQLEWSLEPEQPKIPEQAEVARGLTQIIRSTPRLQSMLMELSEACWFGRYGSQLALGPNDVMGQSRMCILDHQPVNGDKIQFTWEGIPQVYINPSEAARMNIRPQDLVITERTTALRLAHPYWRQRFVIHKHRRDDADFFDGEMAGGVHGVGIRSRVYWGWWLRDELLSWAVDYMEKVGTLGLLVFWYEQGNAKAKAEAEEAAAGSSRKAAIAMGRPAGSEKQTSGVELLPAGTAGITALQDMIANYFERHIERYIIGQTLSGSAQSTGLGSGVADLHADTKFRILKADAVNLAETLTADPVATLKRWNYPNAKFPVRWKFSIPQPENAEKMDAVNKAYSMGVSFVADEVRGLTGFRKPDEGDEVISNKGQEVPGMPGQPGAGNPFGQKPGQPKQLGPGGPKEEKPFRLPSMEQMERLERLLDRVERYETQWDESKHKRAADGKFGSGGGSATGKAGDAKTRDGSGGGEGKSTPATTADQNPLIDEQELTAIVPDEWKEQDGTIKRGIAGKIRSVASVVFQGATKLAQITNLAMCELALPTADEFARSQLSKLADPTAIGSMGAINHMHTAKIVSTLLSKAVVWAKNRNKPKPENYEGVDDLIEIVQVATALRDMLADVYGSLGLAINPPTVREIAARLQAKIEERHNAHPDQYERFDESKIKRAKDGKFARKEGEGAGSSDNPTSSVRPNEHAAEKIKSSGSWDRVKAGAGQGETGTKVNERRDYAWEQTLHAVLGGSDEGWSHESKGVKDITGHVAHADGDEVPVIIDGKHVSGRSQSVDSESGNRARKARAIRKDPSTIVASVAVNLSEANEGRDRGVYVKFGLGTYFSLAGSPDGDGLDKPMKLLDAKDIEKGLDDPTVAGKLRRKLSRALKTIDLDKYMDMNTAQVNNEVTRHSKDFSQLMDDAAAISGSKDETAKAAASGFTKEALGLLASGLSDEQVEELQAALAKRKKK